MELNNLAGLPAHPLLVHAAVIGVPLVVLLGFLIAFRPGLRDRFAVPFAVLAAGLFVYVLLVAGSGEALEERVRESHALEEHAELGEQMRLIVGIYAGIAIAFAGAVKRRLGTTVTLLGIVLAITGIAGIGWTVATGHEGASAVWEDTPAHASEGSGGD